MKLLIEIPEGEFCKGCPINDNNHRCSFYPEEYMRWETFKMKKHRYCNPENFKYFSNNLKVIEESE